MSEEWGIKTGTLYFHLKELGDLITQDQQKQYILTSKGNQVCKWFVKEDTQVQVKKMDSYSQLVKPLYHLLEQSNTFQVILFLIAVVGLVGAGFMNTLLVGPLPLSADPSLSPLTLLIQNTSIFVVQYLLLLFLSGIFGSVKYGSCLRSLVLANSFSYLIITVLVGILYLPLGLNISVMITFIPWFIVSIITQIIFILVITGSLLLGHGFKPERALLIAIALLYIVNSFSLVLVY